MKEIIGLSLVASALIFSGCGGSDDSSTKTDSSSSTETQSSAEETSNSTEDTAVSTDPTSATITHNGISYDTVTSPHTGKIWLDRNLGASRACRAYDDEQCYGDYYQWGREADGHEKSTSSTTSRTASKVPNVGFGEFIATGSSYHFDWAADPDYDGSIRSFTWNKTDGSSICPVDFRVPTIDELKAETIDVGVYNYYDAFESFLKLPLAGSRSAYSGTMVDQGSGGSLWSSSISNSFSYSSLFLGLVHSYSGKTFTTDDGSGRAVGTSVRCIKD